MENQESKIINVIRSDESDVNKNSHDEKNVNEQSHSMEENVLNGEEIFTNNEISNNTTTNLATEVTCTLSDEQFSVIEQKLNSIDSSSFIIMDFIMLLSGLSLAILVYLFLHFMLERRKI